jgi:CRP/FNR family transcriptional regulator, cyclic AMP receptor protein
MSTTEALIMMLARTPLFGALPLAELSLVAVAMSKHAFDAGQAIFGRGDQGDSVFLMLRGRVRLSIVSDDGQPLSYRHALPGEIFGEIAALDGGPRTADAVALTSVNVAVLPSATLLQLVGAHPKLALATIGFLCQRLRSTSEQVEDVVLNRVEVRVARLLLHVHKLNKTSKAEPATIRLGMSQSEMADLIGASRQSVNAALATLEKNGVIKKIGRRLECQIELLTALAGRY